MNSRSALLVCSLASLALFAGACKSASSAQAGKEENCIPAGSPEAAKAPADTAGKTLVVNKVCPIMNADAIPGQMADNECVVEWKGKKVGMCCPGCLPKWAKMNDAQKEAALTKAM